MPCLIIFDRKGDSLILYLNTKTATLSYKHSRLSAFINRQVIGIHTTMIKKQRLKIQSGAVTTNSDKQNER